MESMGNDKRTHKMYRPVKIHFIQMLYVHTHISEMAFAHRFLQNFPYYEIPLSFLLLCSSARPPSLVLWKCLMMFGVGERDFPHLDLLPGETERPRAPVEPSSSSRPRPNIWATNTHNNNAVEERTSDVEMCQRGRGAKVEIALRSTH